jgi:hypothetical protein
MDLAPRLKNKQKKGAWCFGKAKLVEFSYV